ncbi:MAG: hypothetical protein O2973_09130 [Gemmatimonadetes bacterium]|nr:hypothetical protein [Gemmatimonadota bacterium]
MIQGILKDIHPNGPKPSLELSFSIDDSAQLPRGEKVRVRLIVHAVEWNGTMRNDTTRRAYLHTKLNNALNGSSTCSDLFLGLGLAPDAVLEFRLDCRDTLELVRIADPGGWLPGRAPDDRSAAFVRPDPPLPHPHQHARASKGTDPLRRAVPTSFPFENRAEIIELGALYWTLITAGEAAEERAFERELPAARTRGHLDKPLFVRLGRWKSVRPTKRYLSNSESQIRAATATAIAAGDDRSAVRALVSLNGVALRTATAMLHWLRPDRYPILDVRILAALGEQEPKTFEDVAFYSRVGNRVRDIAAKHALDLRTVDRALWAWDKVRSRG